MMKFLTHSLTLFIFFFSLIVPKTLRAEVANHQLPTGGTVVSGTVNISQSSNTMTINQTSSQAIINWETFNLGKDASIYFNNNSSNNTTLNQIVDNFKSVILGSIYSNGKLFINNPNGISIGANANIRAHSFVASAMRIANQDFLNRNYQYTHNQTALLENSGSINAQYVALMAPEVVNKGTITSAQGSTNMAASDNMLLSINEDHSIHIKVNPSSIKASASNKGSIVAENGMVKIRADMAQDAIDATIRAPETAASGIVSVNGVIKLVSNSGSIKAKQITLAAGERGAVEVSGTIDAVSTTGEGGSVELQGKEIIVTTGANINASGTVAGGRLIIGGSWIDHDFNVIQTTFATIQQNSTLDVSSLEGNAGSIFIGSNQSVPGSLTSVQGVLYARTGSSRKKQGGDIELYGYTVNTDNMLADVSSPLEFRGNALGKVHLLEGVENLVLL